ncbi:MAG: DCC1-like thiol-disulfide oxidoreductase family protein [Mucilaginibacter sp.]|uniref:DCC1-like thiol-disulfide oxidoreductase family protein n=1 Tax=Mucilaginibacter sp. TaxID=1882438 RepID=UPI0032667A50
MKTLNNHLILFDAECPMCRLYTSAFVRTSLLEKDGRMAYQHLTADAYPLLDRERAVNEIALVNKATGEVSYGIKSLFKILGQAIPFLKPLFTFAPFVWIMSKFYAFISYNRRVIIPADKHDAFLYQPSFKLKYRIAYLLFTWAVTSYILTCYVQLMHGLLPQGSAYREYIVCGGQMLFQGIIISFIAKDKLWSYLGNMMTISFAGALLLLPGLLMAKLFGIAPLFCVLYFLFVAGLMFLEHIRRAHLLSLGWALSISWVCYRLMVLLLIFLLQ